MWNNRTITVNRKTLFLQSWYKKRIIFVTDILEAHGNFLAFNDFKTKFNIQSSLREYNKICKAIPPALIQMIQNYLHYSGGQVTLPKLQLFQIPLTDKKCNNKGLNKMFKGHLFI